MSISRLTSVISHDTLQLTDAPLLRLCPDHDRWSSSTLASAFTASLSSGMAPLDRTGKMETPL